MSVALRSSFGCAVVPMGAPFVNDRERCIAVLAIRIRMLLGFVQQAVLADAPQDSLACRFRPCRCVRLCRGCHGNEPMINLVRRGEAWRLVWIAVLVVGGCAESSASPPNKSDAGPGAVHGGSGGASGSSAAAFKVGDCTHPDWPSFHICCGMPDELPGSNCVRPEIVDHPCSQEGETQDVKTYRVCCKGLTPIETSMPGLEAAAGGCMLEFGLDPTRFCTHCGDGACGLKENVCNCPEDCRALDASVERDAS
jgi:hypothetical protein